MSLPLLKRFSRFQDARQFLKKFPMLIFLFQSVRRPVAAGVRFFVIACEAIAELFNGKKNFRILTKTQSTYFGDGFATTHHVAFLHDTRFVKAYNEAFEGVPDSVALRIKKLDIAWRAHICTWAATQALSIKGDFIECGVWHGILSKTICNYVDFAKQPKKFYLVDTWGESIGSHVNYKDDIFNAVKSRFSPYPNVHLIRGLVPDVLDQIEITEIAYLSIDMNGSVAERATLERYYEKVVPGGIIYFDDYGWEYPELRRTIDEFFSDKPETLLHFPSGNSIMVKL